MQTITETNKVAILGAKVFLGLVVLLSSAFCLAESGKPIVAIGDIKSSIANYDTRNLQGAIETALTKTRKFSVMARGDLDQLLAEQALGASGMVNGSGQMGGFDGVDYIISGRITQLGFESKNLLIISACEAQFGLDIKVQDVQTGEIRLAENLSEADQVNTASTEEDPCRGISISAFDNLTAKVARKLAEKLTQSLYPVKLAKVSSEEVYLNYGEGFLKNGEILKVVALGEGFEDPDTGEIIGAEEELMAVVKVTKLRPKFSIAKILMQTGSLSRGDVANRLSKKGQKNASKMIKNCQKAIKRMDKSCKKDGSKCDKATDKKLNACILK
jgi:hypothetical protein